jgi:hypothetical protein
VARTEPELESSAREPVKGDRLPGDLGGIAYIGVEDKGAESNTTRRLGDGGQQLHGRVLRADVIAHEDDVEAGLFGIDRLLDRVVVEPASQSETETKRRSHGVIFTRGISLALPNSAWRELGSRLT